MKLLLTKGILNTHPPICDCDGCRISSPIPQVQPTPMTPQLQQQVGFDFFFILKVGLSR